MFDEKRALPKSTETRNHATSEGLFDVIRFELVIFVQMVIEGSLTRELSAAMRAVENKLCIGMVQNDMMEKFEFGEVGFIAPGAV